MSTAISIRLPSPHSLTSLLLWSSLAGLHGCGGQADSASTFADSGANADASSPAGFRLDDTGQPVGPGLDSDADDAPSGDAAEAPNGADGDGGTIVAGEGASPSPPTSVVLSPAAPGLATLLTCASTPGVDPDGGTTMTVTRWFVDGYENLAVSGDTITGLELVSGPSEPARAGDSVRCRQWASDGAFVSSPVDSNIVTLVPSPPTSGGVLVSPGEVAEGDVVICVPGSATDIDGDVVTWIWSWLVDGQPVSGQTSANLTSDYFDRGQEVRCVATPVDSAGQGLPTTSKNGALVVNTPPTITSASVTPTVVGIDGTFTCTWAGWVDPDPADVPAATIIWQRLTSGAPVTLPNQTTTLSASAVGAGATVRCIVTPTDGLTAGPPVTSNDATVASGQSTCADVSTQLDLTVTTVPPSVLLVVDRSGSMLEAWSETKSAVGTVLAGLGPDAKAGLLMYPADKSCSISDGPQVPFGPAQTSTIVAAMGAAGVGGSTPMGRALRKAREYLETAATSNTTVILAADGKPSDTCLEDCTGCDCTDEATCLWCADLIECTYAEVRKEVTLLKSLGIRTFVVGYQGGFGATEFLASLADEGGTAEVGPTPFFDAGDGSELATVLDAITGELGLCTAKLTVPNSYASLSVTVNGVPVAEDPSGNDGWTLEPGGTLRLHGSACDGATTPNAVVDASFACP